MKRRDAIKLGAAAAAAAALPDCGIPRMLSELSGDDGAAAFNHMLDDQLAQLAQPGFLALIIEEHLGRPLTPAVQSKLLEKDAAFRRMLGTLLVSQGFRELPMDTQLHPAVQQRMSEHADELGATVFEVADMLSTMTPDDRANVQRTLREQPDFGMDVGEHIDRRAAAAGVSVARRLQFRQLMASATFRLKHGDPGAMIDEHVAKVERLRAADGNDATLLALTKRFGEQAFWQYEQRLAQSSGAAGAPGTAPPTTAPPTTAPQPSANDDDPAPQPQPTATPAVHRPTPWNSPPAPVQPGPTRSGGTKAALIILVIGGVTVGGGLLIAIIGGGAGSMLAVTIGGILFLLGLVVLLIAGIVAAIAAIAGA